MTDGPRFPCLRCGVAIYLVGCCRDCRSTDPAMCEAFTSEALRYRTRHGSRRARPIPA